MGWLVIAVIIAAKLWPAVLALAETSDPQVVINEISWAGSTVDGTDEWIELKNLTSSAQDIGNWNLTINTLVITLPTTAVIPADGFYLIAKYKDTDPDSALNTEVDLDRTGKQFSIPNNGFTIALKDAADVTMDQAWDGSAPPSDGSYGHRNSTSSASIERKTPIGKGEEKTSWQVALASSNFDDSNDATPKNWGTPKSANSVMAEPLTLLSMTPAQAELGTSLTIKEISGSGFSVVPVPTVKLICPDREIVATGINVADPTLIDNGSFNLSESKAGQCDLVVTNPDTQMALLSNAIELVEPPERYDLTTTIRLNEIYPQPNTTANDEYIELHNFGDKAVDLDGWILDDMRDGGSSQLEIAGRTIPPKSYLTLYKSETKLTLNDTGDSVYLIQPNGFELDRTSYVDAPRGQTWARFDDGWKWTSSPTPNGKNVLAEPDELPAQSPSVDEPDDVAPSFRAGVVLITELLPNPHDDEEFIELQNTSQNPIDLRDWVLQDKSKHKYRISQFALNVQTTSELTVQPQQYVVITDAMSGIALNNIGGEIVTLLDPVGNVIATAAYPDKAPTDATYALADGLWTWSLQPTPGAMNILGLDEADEPPPNVDVVSLITTLPVTGTATRRWWGTMIVVLAMSAIVGLNYAKGRHTQLG